MKEIENSNRLYARGFKWNEYLWEGDCGIQQFSQDDSMIPQTKVNPRYNSATLPIWDIFSLPTKQQAQIYTDTYFLCN